VLRFVLPLRCAGHPTRPRPFIRQRSGLLPCARAPDAGAAPASLAFRKGRGRVEVPAQRSGSTSLLHRGSRRERHRGRCRTRAVSHFKEAISVAERGGAPMARRVASVNRGQPASVERRGITAPPWLVSWAPPGGGSWS